MYERQEREISFKSMFFSIFYKWKSLLAVGLILALALGGIQGFRAGKKDESQENGQGAYQEYLEQLALYEEKTAGLENEIRVLESQIQAQDLYLQNATIMKLDSYHVAVEKVQLYISAGEHRIEEETEASPVSDMVEAYRVLLGGEGAIEECAGRLGMESRYLKDSISVLPSGSHSLVIGVWASSPEEAKIIMDTLLDRLEEASSRVTETIGIHSLSQVVRTAGSGIDRNLARRQDDEKEVLQNMVQRVEEKKKALDGLIPPVKVSAQQGVASRQALKGAVLGAVLGIILMAVIHACRYVFGDRIYSGEELQVRMGIRLLGVCRDSGPDRDPLIRWLRKREKRAVFTPEESMALFARTVEAADCGSVIFLAGDGSREELQKFAGELEKALGQNRRVLWGDLLCQAEALDDLLRCDSVVLLARTGKSRYSTAGKQAVAAYNADRPLLGCIAME